jgi:glycosyltransferase involved in cell wall biosynthesis
MDEPKISVLMPVYNSSKFIEKTLRSLMKQTYTNIEIITLNDGSTDNSLEILNKLANEDNRIKVFSKKNEKSLPKTRNYLLSLNHNEYFVFTDSDDIVDKDYIKVLYENLINYNADLSICGFKWQLQEMPFINQPIKILTFTSPEHAIQRMILDKNIHFFLWNRMFKTSIAQGIKFDESYLQGEDLMYTIDYTKKCKKIVYTNELLYHYILRKTSEVHQNFSIKNITFIESLKKQIELEENPVIKDSLKTWMYISCCFYARLLKRQKNYNKEFLELCVNTAKEYKTPFLKIKNMCFDYKVFCCFAKVFYLNNTFRKSKNKKA